MIVTSLPSRLISASPSGISSSCVERLDHALGAVEKFALENQYRIVVADRGLQKGPSRRAESRACKFSGPEHSRKDTRWRANELRRADAPVR